MAKPEKSLFKPNYTLTPEIVQYLLRIEAIKQEATLLPMNPVVMASLRQTAKLYATHYSTMIEGNRLTEQEVVQVVIDNKHIPGRERDEREVKGYYVALSAVEQYAQAKKPITQEIIKKLHALVMAGGSQRVKPTPYRDGQNVIKDGKSGAIGYLPPEAKDVSQLMHDLVLWIKENNNLPCPLVAAIAHYQFATIHPYYDGNGRTARLLTMLILYLGGYDLKGLYALEEYYAQDLQAYYHAISIGSSHNYYMGRAEADITPWIAYFVKGMATAYEKVINQMKRAHTAGFQDHEKLMRDLDPMQRKVLQLFKKYTAVKSKQIAKFLGLNQRAASLLCKKWVLQGYLKVADPSYKARTYALAQPYVSLLK